MRVRAERGSFQFRDSAVFVRGAEAESEAGDATTRAEPVRPRE
jgi:hypothetical protein